MLPDITSTIVLEGVGDAIDGGDSVRIFYVQSGSNLTINQTTLQNGFVGSGGAIYNNGGTVTRQLKQRLLRQLGDRWRWYLECWCHDSDQQQLLATTVRPTRGGAILSRAAMTVTDSTFSGNSAVDGGGIWNDGGDFTVINSTFS